MQEVKSGGKQACQEAADQGGLTELAETVQYAARALFFRSYP